MEPPPPYCESVPQTPATAPVDLDFRPFLLNRTSYVPGGSPGLIPPVPTTDTLTFVDFLPPGSPDQNYLPFRALLENANIWLATAPRWRIKMCETIQCALKETGQLEGLAYVEDISQPHRYIQGLRLWVEPGESTDVLPGIDCLTVLPNSTTVVHKGRQAVRFEKLEDMLKRVKSELEFHPIPGRILSVDSRRTYAPNVQLFDPDSTFFCEEGLYEKHYITVIRIFYEKGPPLYESIEVIDFYPTSTIKMFSDVKREAVTQLSERAFASLSAFGEHLEDVNIRLTNIQTLEVEVKPGVKVDTSRLKVTEENQRTEHVRFLRAVSVKRCVNRSSDSTYLNEDSSCKTFLPLKIPVSTPMNVLVESIEKTKERMEAWIRATGAEILCAETVQIRSAIGERPESLTEKTDSQAANSYQWLTAFRLYLNKTYAEPDAGMLPALPRIERKQACIIS